MSHVPAQVEDLEQMECLVLKTTERFAAQPWEAENPVDHLLNYYSITDNHTKAVSPLAKCMAFYLVVSCSCALLCPLDLALCLAALGNVSTLSLLHCGCEHCPFLVLTSSGAIDCSECRMHLYLSLPPRPVPLPPHTPFLSSPPPFVPICPISPRCFVPPA